MDKGAQNKKQKNVRLGFRIFNVIMIIVVAAIMLYQYFTTGHVTWGAR